MSVVSMVDREEARVRRARRRREREGEGAGKGGTVTVPGSDDKEDVYVPPAVDILGQGI